MDRDRVANSAYFRGTARLFPEPYNTRGPFDTWSGTTVIIIIAPPPPPRKRIWLFNNRYARTHNLPTYVKRYVGIL